MKKLLYALCMAGTVVLFNGCRTTAATVQCKVLPGLKLACCWQAPHDPAKAVQLWQQLPDDLFSQCCWQLERFRSQGDNAADLHKCRLDLLENVRRDPGQINTFILAEILNESGFDGYDPYLAALLYAYSADSAFPPAMARWGSMLIDGKIPAADPVAGEKLLLQAVKAGSGEAAWQLLKFYQKSNRNIEAAEMLEKAGRLAYKALRSDSAYNLYDQALSNREWTPKTYQLEHALKLGAPRAALALGVIYSEKPLRNWYMANAAALLAYRRLETRQEAAVLLRELDKQETAAFIVSALWHGKLQDHRDLAAAMVNSDAVLQSRELEEQAKVTASWKKLLQQEQENVYRSGLILRLIDDGINPSDLSCELRKYPPQTLSGWVTHAVAAAVSGDKKRQLETSTGLLNFVRKLPEKTDLPDSRYALLAVIKGVAELPENYIGRDLKQSRCALWNLSVLLHAEALHCAQGSGSAGKFLREHFRYKLAEPYKSWEKNFARKYAPTLLGLQK